MRYLSVLALFMAIMPFAHGQQAPQPFQSSLESHAFFRSPGLKLGPAAPLDVPLPFKESLVPIDPQEVEVKQTDRRWQLWAGKVLIKEFGPLEKEASQAAMTIRGMNSSPVTLKGEQGGESRVAPRARMVFLGFIPGSEPPFDYWLDDSGRPVQMGAGSHTLIPMRSKSMSVEAVAGAWVLRDDRALLFNFGNQKESAEQALAVCRKYGFNQIGLVGAPKPVMTFLVASNIQSPMDGRMGMTQMQTADVVSRLGLILPGLGYVGPRVEIDQHKLDVLMQQGEWYVVQEAETLARFGKDGNQAHDMLQLLRNSHVSEICKVGKSGFPIYLSNSQPVRRVPLGSKTLEFHTRDLRLVKAGGGWGIVDGLVHVQDFGENKADAEMMLKVVQYFHFDTVILMGDQKIYAKVR